MLPTFDEPLKDRVWFGSGLVRGDTDIKTPLRDLKRCGDVAARLLLALYVGQDTDHWYGIPPDRFPWLDYKMEDETASAARVIYATRGSINGLCWPLVDRINRGHTKLEGSRAEACWEALGTLESHGFLYPAVVLLDRNPLPSTSNDKNALNIHADADIVCDLGCPSFDGPLIR